MKRPRRPRQAFERLFSLKPTAKQRIHALLRHDPALSSRQLANAVGCTTAYARIWRRNFFAPTYELEDPDGLQERDSTSTPQSEGRDHRDEPLRSSQPLRVQEKA
jgi:hypothetical protein